MTAIQRNNAVGGPVSGAKMGSGGSGRAPMAAPGGRVRRRLEPPDDPAAELMPAAEFLGHETDFHAILEDFRDSPFDPARRRVLGKLMGMFAMDYQGARPEERRFLRRLLNGGNPREGYVANRALHLCGASPVIRRTLALGVSEARFDRERRVGFLGAVQARVAATVFKTLGPRGREAVWNLLTAAGTEADGNPAPGADRVIERALILKAVAARRHRLGPWSRDGEGALVEIDRFADAIRGNNRANLAARTTLVPGDPERPPPTSTAVEVARGDVDPAFAWEAHGNKSERADKGERPAAADDVLPDLDRGLLLDRPRLHWALAEARARKADTLDAEQCEALTDYIIGRPLRAKVEPVKDAALERMHEVGFDVVRLDAIEWIRQDAQGIYKFDAARALGDLMSRYTGAMYVRRVFSDQTTAGLDPLQQIATALERGLAVPIMINELKLPVTRAYAAVGWEGPPTVGEIELADPQIDRRFTIPFKQLLASKLPDGFGQQTRADAYMAPVALDLLAPPFGIPFPDLGIEDRL